MNDAKIRKITTIGMMCAVAYVLMYVVRIPVVLFLKYEPKDVIIAIGGFLMGPMTAFTISVVVGLIEMITASDTGIIGMVMNIISSCAYTCTAALIYKKMRHMKGAVAGLIAGTVVMVCVMTLWNYLITPLYMNMPRDEVAKLLVPAIIPFNILKGTLNSAIVFLVYKPIVRGLRRTSLVPTGSGERKKSPTGIYIIACLLVVTCVLAVLAFNGII